jgi:hypothetical protein
MKQFVPLPKADKKKTLLNYRGRDIIIFGAGVFSQPVIHSLRQLEIDPVCVCDNSISKQGTEVMGVSVILPGEAIQKYPDALIIITAAWKYFDEINSQLKKLGWTDIIDCAVFLSEFEYDMNTFVNGVGSLHLDIDSYLYEYFCKSYPDKLILPSVDLIITEKCSLKCIDCSNLMQYYVQPQDIEFDGLFNSLDALMQSVDHVFEFRVLGGETFMNKRAHEYINRLLEYKNFSRIAVYSNGTIVPKDENLRCLKNDRIYLRISDYGEISKNVKMMTDTFDSLGVVYDSQKITMWQDCAHVGYIKRTEDELKSVYSTCCAKNTFSLLKGNLYICPFSANASNLGMIPRFTEEIISLDKNSSSQEIRTKLFDMLRNKSYFSVCNYCLGRSLDEISIPAALQTAKPLVYNKSGKGVI